MITESLKVPTSEFERQTGWALKPEGACKGDMCVPMPAGAADGSTVDVAVVAERLGMPVVADEARGLYALGPESLTGHVLTSAEAPELTLPDLDGNLFSLSSLRGQKVLLVAWAPY